MMLATFYGGPADGGELAVLEPVPLWLRFPMSHDDLITLLGHVPSNHTTVPNVPGAYKLAVDPKGVAFRDTLGRIRYVYQVPTSSTPTPTEGEQTT